MTETEYMKQRVDDQITWYSRKSGASQRAYKTLRVTEILAAAAVPVLAAYSDTHLAIKVGVGLLGAVVAVIAGVLGLYQFQENWTNYRSTCESLKHEKYLYQTKTEPYHGEAPFTLFVQRVESLVSKENSSWAQYMKSEAAGQPTGAATE